MSYQALYRKWRPAVFDEMRGQDHIVTTLKNQIKADRIGHAYLFTGTRGTGKTSAAKIFARAVNCEHPQDGSPCNTCAMCRGILDQTSMNVVEIDAASNNGVDNIRQIREDVAYPPAQGRYRVYIIDEVHMLSIGAFNALLKTLEEPPPYVIFILATTEVNRIPITILSRCQRYDFRRIDVDTLSSRLTELIGREALSVEERAVRYIARMADGSMRDALSLLDQCVAFYLGEQLTYEHVLDVLGAVDTSVFHELLQCILEARFTDAVRVLERVITEGRELSQFVNDFIWYLRNLLLVGQTPDLEDVLDMSGENLERLKMQAQDVEPARIMRYIRVFSELSGQMRYASQKRVLLEVALVKLCRPETEGRGGSAQTQLARLYERLENLEAQLASGQITLAGGSQAGGTAAAGTGQIPDGMPSAGSMPGPGGMNGTQGQSGGYTPAVPRAMPEDVRLVIESWPKILGDLGMAAPVAARMLQDVRLNQEGDDRLVIGFVNALGKSYFDQESHRTQLEQVITERIRKSVTVVPAQIQSEQEAKTGYFSLDSLNLEGVEVSFEDEDD